MLNEARGGMRSIPNLMVATGGAIFLTVLAFILLGEGLRDAFQVEEHDLSEPHVGAEPCAHGRNSDRQLLVRSRSCSWEKAHAHSRAFFERFGIPYEKAATYPFQLSGWMRPRTPMATVLAMQPQLLLLDGPTAGLDEKTKERLIDILRNLEITLLVVSYEPLAKLLPFVVGYPLSTNENSTCCSCKIPSLRGIEG